MNHNKKKVNVKKSKKLEFTWKKEPLAASNIKKKKFK
jgi:hypothetical protein